MHFSQWINAMLSSLYLPNETMEWTLSISQAWHWINLSHTRKGPSGDKVTITVSLLSHSLTLSLSVFSCPLYFPVQLTVTECGHIASCPFILQAVPGSTLSFWHLAITLQLSDVLGACVTMIPCEKTPACSQWPPTGNAASEAAVPTLSQINLGALRQNVEPHRSGSWFQWKGE